ncbi:MAG: N-acetyl-gamma-glutamyl-phosphate reductase [Bacteroidetes bacterium]|nr:N-acetyl-gamma-glutamyl-phosphate reductase [Bacteroidota bacterium]
MQSSKTIRAGVVGAAGYAGGELIRLLLRHPQAELVFAQSRSSAGKPICSIHQDLLGDTELQFCEAINADVDVLFLCLGHGAARLFLAEHPLPEELKIIDLSQDFRLHEQAVIGSRRFVYGLPEWNRDTLKLAGNIANPGCFATAIQLGLLPLAAQGLLGTVHTTGITGSTGAGQSFSASAHFSWRAGNIQAYKTLKHQHVAEVQQTLSSVSGQQEPEVHFVPWRGDFTRGIFVSSVVDCAWQEEEIFGLYQDYYRDACFTHFSKEPVDMKRVLNTNKCIISLEKSGNQLAVHSALDNLLKGASGQALQNMNLLFDLPEDAGLRLKASAF